MIEVNHAVTNAKSLIPVADAMSPIEVAETLTNAIFTLMYYIYAARLEKEKTILEAQHEEVLVETLTAEPSPELKKHNEELARAYLLVDQLKILLHGQKYLASQDFRHEPAKIRKFLQDVLHYVDNIINSPVVDPGNMKHVMLDGHNLEKRFAETDFNLDHIILKISPVIREIELSTELLVEKDKKDETLTKLGDALKIVQAVKAVLAEYKNRNNKSTPDEIAELITLFGQIKTAREDIVKVQADLVK